MSEAAAPATVPRPNLSSPHCRAAVLPLVLRTGLPALRAAVRGRRAAGDRAPSFCRIFDLHVGLLHLVANRLLALRGLLAHADLLGNPGSLLDDRFLGHFAYFDGLFLESFVAGADRAVYGNDEHITVLADGDRPVDRSVDGHTLYVDLVVRQARDDAFLATLYSLGDAYAPGLHRALANRELFAGE